MIFSGRLWQVLHTYHLEIRQKNYRLRRMKQTKLVKAKENLLTEYWKQLRQTKNVKTCIMVAAKWIGNGVDYFESMYTCLFLC